jgi:uncharacterized protein (DUF934 family)
MADASHAPDAVSEAKAGAPAAGPVFEDNPSSAPDFLRFRDDAPHEEPAVTLESFLGQSNATAVRLEPGDDSRALLPFLDRLALVEVSFPTFRDGRGYSAARILREAGYRGELRAEGDVLVDQLAFMRRCGFDSFAPAAPIDEETAQASLSRYESVYQPAADGAAPVWRLRHG